MKTYQNNHNLIEMLLRILIKTLNLNVLFQINLFCRFFFGKSNYCYAFFYEFQRQIKIDDLNKRQQIKKR